MKILHLLFCLTSLLVGGCHFSSSQKKNANNTFTIPQLLDRNEKLYYDKEWENVQNEYVHARENLKTEKANPESYLKLAAIFTNEARITGEHGHYYPAALEVLNQALKKEENSDIKFRAMTMKAGVLLSQHEFQQALDLGLEAIQLNPYNSHIYGVLVDAYVELGDYKSAILMSDKMINVRPDLRSYSRVSYLREIHGDIDGAIEAMQMAINAGYPTHEQTAWARLTLGELFQNQGNLAKAEEQYNIILTQRKDYPFAIAALADIEIEKGNLEKGEALLKEAITIIPEVGFYVQLAELYKNTNRKDAFDAIVPAIFIMLQDDVDHGHNMNLEYASLHFDLLEDYDQALIYVKKEFNKRPTNIDVNRMLAQIYSAKGDLETAAKFTKIAERTGSVHPDLLFVKTLLASN